VAATPSERPYAEPPIQDIVPPTAITATATIESSVARSEKRVAATGVV
jgi:hypothetical protein